MRKVFIVSLSLLAANLSGCASSPSSITAQYVSPLQYQSYSCEQIESELLRLSSRVAEVTGQQQHEATKDAITMGVGIVIFWPTLFLLAGDGDKKAELGRLKGEYEALQVNANTKNCGRPNSAPTSANATITNSVN